MKDLQVVADGEAEDVVGGHLNSLGPRVGPPAVVHLGCLLVQLETC